MSFVFTVLGWLLIVAGGGWVALTVNAARSASQAGTSSSITMATAMAMAPGFGLMFTGMMLLAVSAVVWRLARIDRNTAASAAALGRIAGANEQGR